MNKSPSKSRFRFSLLTLMGLAVWGASLVAIPLRWNPWVVGESITYANEGKFFKDTGWLSLSPLSENRLASLKENHLNENERHLILELSTNLTPEKRNPELIYVKDISHLPSGTDIQFVDKNTLLLVITTYSQTYIGYGDDGIIESRIFEFRVPITALYFHRRHPEQWYGHFYRPETWLFLATSSLLAFRAFGWWRRRNA